MLPRAMPAGVDFAATTVLIAAACGSIMLETHSWMRGGLEPLSSLPFGLTI